VLKRAVTPALFIFIFSALSAGAAESPDAAQQDPSPGGRAVSSTTPAVMLPQASTAPAAAVTQPIAAQPPRYSREILSAQKHLSILLSKGSLVDQKELDSVAKEISELDGRVTALLGPAIISEVEEKEKVLLARAQLQRMRAFLLAYYSDGDGKYPETPAELVPGYIPAVPELELPWHGKTGELSLIDEAGAGPAEVVTDTGGWLYFADPKSSNFGMLTLNCSHKDSDGVEMYKY
jgi:hypothetical protein